MFGSQILDVAIGIIFIYLLLSLVASSVREAIESVLKVRAVMLERGIRELLRDETGTGVTTAIYRHPLVDGLFRGTYDPAKIKRDRMPLGSTLPSYIPSANFARALLDIVVRGSDPTNAANATAAAPVLDLPTVRAKLGTLNNAPVQRALLQALDTAGDLPTLQANVEAWFNSTMDRISGWYKRQTQFYLFLLGVALTIAVNANTITIASYLYGNKTAREALSDSAAAHVVAHDTTAARLELTSRLKELAALDLPIGWDKAWPGPKIGGLSDLRAWLWPDILLPLFGWLLTAFAIALGAPFWFDTLNKLMVVRSTTKPAAPTPAPAPPVTTPAVPVPSAGVLFVPRQWAVGDPHEGSG